MQQQQQQFTLTETVTHKRESESESESESKVISVSVLSSISEVASAEWDACAVDATGPDKLNPFVSHAFLSSLEHSGSAATETGWAPHHIIAKDQSNNAILAAVPLYLKRFSIPIPIPILTTN